MQASARTTRPCDVFIFLNMKKTTEGEMKGLEQPTLPQIQYYLRNYREITLGSGSNTTDDIKAKIKAHQYHPNIKDEDGFFFGYEVDANGEPIVEADNFRVGFTSKKLLSYFNISSFPIFHIDNTYSVNKYRYPLLAFGRSDYSGHFFLIASYICKHIVALAIKEKFKIKGFIPVDTLVPNNKSGRKKALTLDGKNANLTPNKRIRDTYKRK